MSDGLTPMATVSITERRVRYIKGWLTGGTDPLDGSVECGDGTEYPMEVTRAQLEEIFYRVKDAWFVSGAMNDTDAFGSVLTFTGTAPGAALAEDFTDYASERGYHTVIEPTGNLVELFGASYTVGPGNVWDIAAFERGMWAANSVDLFYFGGGAGNPNSTELLVSCAFNTYMRVDTSDEPTGYSLTFSPWPSDPGFFGITKDLFLGFNGQVAWTGADHPFAPGATLYLRLDFQVQGFGSDFSAMSGSGSLLATVKLELELANSSVYCNLYGNEASSGGSNFVCKAQKWWPYADNAGLPAWDAATGSAINGGPGG